MAQSPVEFETIIISPFKPIHCDTWVKEEEPEGTVRAINRGFAAALGEWVVVFCDEVMPRQGWADNMLRVMRHHPQGMGAFSVVPHFDFKYFGKEFSPFMFIRRERAIELGGLLDPAYHAFYADPDLSMRLYEAGGQVIHVNESVLEFYNVHDHNHAMNVSRYLKQDRETFQKRWDHLGELIDP